MKRNVFLAVGLFVVLLVALVQPAFAKDVSDSMDNAKGIKANKTYTQQFEKEGDIDCFSFVSGGGKYKIKIWDSRGCITVSSGAVSSYGDYSVGAYFELSPTYYYYWPKDEELPEDAAWPPEVISLDKVKKGTQFHITFKGYFVGEYKFRIIGKAAPSSASSSKKSSKVKLTSSNTKITVKDVKYTGKAQKPAVTVKCKSKKLKKGTDYSVSYSNNVEVGKATVKITGKGNYKGTVKGSFKIKSVEKKIYALAFGGAKGEPTSSTDNVRKMYETFLGLKIPGYNSSTKVVKKKDYKGFSKKRLLEAVEETCGKATSSDISFIYINAHGKAREKNEKGDLDFPGIATGEGHNGYYAWADVIEDLGSRVKGKIILLTEVCYSGNFVDAAKNSKVRDRIAVITAAGKTIKANQVDDIYFKKFVIANGTYTQALARGLGYQARNNAYKRLVADKNGDGKVTLGELGGYIVNDEKLKEIEQRPMLYFGGSLNKFVLYKA